MTKITLATTAGDFELDAETIQVWQRLEGAELQAEMERWAAAQAGRHVKVVAFFMDEEEPSPASPSTTSRRPTP
jgi:hypothetical protein